MTGLTQGVLDWARNRFGGYGMDRVFHQSMTVSESSPEDVSRAAEYWRSKGVELDAPKTRFVWSGSLIHETDGHTLLEAIEALPSEVAERTQFIFCGTGALVPEIEARAAKLPHLIYAGWVGHNELRSLTLASHIGLLCYLDRLDFRIIIPNKVVDYCAASMRTLTNLSGEVLRLLGEGDSVISYPTGNVQALTGILTEVALHPDRYRLKHPPSYAVFRAHFDAEKVQRDYVNYLEGMVRS